MGPHNNQTFKCLRHIMLVMRGACLIPRDDSDRRDGEWWEGRTIRSFAGIDYIYMYIVDSLNYAYINQYQHTFRWVEQG